MFSRIFKIDPQKIIESLIFTPILHVNTGADLSMKDIADLTRELGEPCWRTCLQGVDLNNIEEWSKEIGMSFGQPPRVHDFVIEFDANSDWDREQNKYTKFWHQDYTATEKPVKFCMLYCKDADYDTPPTEIIDLVSEYKHSSYQNFGGKLLHKVFEPKGEGIDTILKTNQEGSYAHDVVQDWFGQKHFMFNPAFNMEDPRWAEFSTTILKEIMDRPEGTRYIHEWKKGDILIWNHTATLHRAKVPEDFKGRRVMYRSNFDDNKVKEFHAQFVVSK